MKEIREADLVKRVRVVNLAVVPSAKAGKGSERQEMVASGEFVPVGWAPLEAGSPI